MMLLRHNEICLSRHVRQERAALDGENLQLPSSVPPKNLVTKPMAADVPVLPAPALEPSLTPSCQYPQAHMGYLHTLE